MSESGGQDFREVIKTYAQVQADGYGKGAIVIKSQPGFDVPNVSYVQPTRALRRILNKAAHRNPQVDKDTLWNRILQHNDDNECVILWIAGPLMKGSYAGPYKKIPQEYESAFPLP